VFSKVEVKRTSLSCPGVNYGARKLYNLGRKTLFLDDRQKTGEFAEIFIYFSKNLKYIVCSKKTCLPCSVWQIDFCQFLFGAAESN
jgi:hypothetical protein